MILVLKNSLQPFNQKLIKIVWTLKIYVKIHQDSCKTWEKVKYHTYKGDKASAGHKAFEKFMNEFTKLPLMKI